MEREFTIARTNAEKKAIEGTPEYMDLRRRCVT